jgi:hypothetical protein
MLNGDTIRGEYDNDPSLAYLSSSVSFVLSSHAKGESTNLFSIYNEQRKELTSNERSHIFPWLLNDSNMLIFDYEDIIVINFFLRFEIFLLDKLNDQ